MSTAIALLFVVHGLAMAALMAMGRYSQVLVDDDGRPLTVRWREATIPEGPPSRHAAEEGSRQA